MIELKGWYTLEFRKNGGIHILNPDLGSIYVSRDINLKKQVWLQEEAIKVKSTPGMSFTMESYNLNKIEDI